MVLVKRATNVAESCKLTACGSIAKKTKATHYLGLVLLLKKKTQCRKKI